MDSQTSSSHASSYASSISSRMTRQDSENTENEDNKEQPAHGQLLPVASTPSHIESDLLLGISE